MARTPAPALTLLAATAVAAFALIPGLAAAALPAADPPTTEVTWSVAPANDTGIDGRPAFAYAVDPGSQIRDQVAISNAGAETAIFQVYAQDAITDFDTGAFGLLTSDEDASDLGSWTTPIAASVEVAPGQSVVLPFEILVPSDASPGDHAAGIVASITVETTDPDGQQIKLEQRVAARIYLRVSGDVEARVEATGLVSGFAPSWNPFSGGEASVDYAVSNTGNVRVDVVQRIVVRGPFGIELGTIRLDPVLNILPGQSAHVHATADGIPPLVLLWSTVTLTPGEPTDLVAESNEQNVDGTPAEPREELTYESASAETVTAAISWILLIITILLVILVWLAARYLGATRERMYAAIDAAAEEAREEALREGASERVPEDAR